MFAPYILLVLLITGCWFTQKKNLLIIASSVLVLIAIITGFMEFSGAMTLFAYGVTAYAWAQAQLKTPIWRIIFGFLFFAFSLALMNHICPGFNNIKFFDSIQFSTSSLPFSMHLNFDKPFVGLALLIFSAPRQQITSFREITGFLKKSLPIYLGLLVVILPIALIMNYIAFEPKYPPDKSLS